MGDTPCQPSLGKPGGDPKKRWGNHHRRDPFVLMVPTENGGVHMSKSAKRRARKARVIDKAVADGKDFINSFDKHLKYTQSSHDYKRLYNKVRRGTPS